MRIAQLTSNYQPVSPTFRKAIGSHVASLTDGLVGRGHEVHLFASSDSETKGVLHSVSESLVRQELSDEARRYLMMLNITRCYEFARTNADIVHSHYNLLPLFSSSLIDVPTLTSIHSPIDERTRPFIAEFKRERFVSFSLAQRQQAPELNWYANIYHGVSMDLFAFNPEPEDYLLYLGRITEDKGVHFAIEAAKAAGLPLRIAGTSYPTEGYWHKYIEPHINGTNVRYFGHAELADKIKLLQGARALLFPTQVSEVFGYAMIEAMACGTPVIGFNNGSVPEIVKHGVTGFVVNDAEEMAAAIGKISSIDRYAVRRRAETYFSVEKMVKGYERVYKRVLEEREFHATKRTRRLLKESVERFGASGQA